jgi:hypothetical protein
MKDIYTELSEYLINAEKTDKVSSDAMEGISFAPASSTEYMDNLLSQEVGIESVLSGVKMGGEKSVSVLNLSKQAGEDLEYTAWPPLPGTRVAFSDELSAMFAYKNSPDPSETGTVVLVRCASGDTTHINDYAFVKWDSGRFMHIYRDHLMKSATSKTASVTPPARIRVASLGDLTSFFNSAAGSKNELVHKSSRDLWSLKKEGDSYVLNRLFDEHGRPLSEG